jgi:hypothetical protein
VATSKRPGPLARWATSTKNIVGVGLAAVGPALGIAGVVNPMLGLALAPALYVVGVLAAPGRKRVDLATGIDPRNVRRSLDEIERRIRRRVPDAVRARVHHIAVTITQCIARADALGGGSSEVFGLVKTATDYLPTALQVYLDLPRAYADRRIVTGNKTALDLLIEQLDLMSKKMDEVAEAVHRADTDKLMAHGRFLAEKFGKSDRDLDLDTP